MLAACGGGGDDDAASYSVDGVTIDVEDAGGSDVVLTVVNDRDEPIGVVDVEQRRFRRDGDHLVVGVGEAEEGVEYDERPSQDGVYVAPGDSVELSAAVPDTMRGDEVQLCLEVDRDLDVEARDSGSVVQLPVRDAGEAAAYACSDALTIEG